MQLTGTNTADSVPRARRSSVRRGLQQGDGSAGGLKNPAGRD